MARMLCFVLCLLLAPPNVAWSAPNGDSRETQISKKRTKAAKPQKGAKNGHKPVSEENLPPLDGTSRLGYLLMDMKTGQILESQHASELFIPASVAKVPSTLAALHILGAQHRFVTSVQTPGKVVNGVLQGDLILVGGGDPSLNMSGMIDLVHQLQSQGVQQVQGRFLFDETAMIPEANISQEQNDEESYNQGLSALTLDANRVRMRWMINKSGQLMTQTMPNLRHIIISSAPSSKSGPALLYLGGEKEERWSLNTRGGRSGWDWIPLKRPGRHAALAFRALCHQSGIALGEPEAGRTLPNATVLASHASASLSELADSALGHSNNLWTEMIGIMAASHLTRQPQSSVSAARILSEWLKRQLPQTDWNGFHLTNSSGLSATSRVTPRQLVSILLLANSAPIGDRTYASLLPISGWKGTLAGRFTGPDGAMRVWAKTGTILYGKGLAGYLFTRQNSQLVFAVFASDFEKRRLFDADKTSHTADELHRGKRWNHVAWGHISALVERWLRTY
ncbi:MAG: D-alanyl-D-alanine carboxypeptidase/D-alanyl-D-alanine-endopeptidase [Magnetococcales bacterium]|nr:D-alanyl-D-alanine carboxypeptidase/D-alanyl-D-alanine-endopeptidase [Magnetococcales bacterium]